jgi:hypothetical protein
MVGIGQPYSLAFRRLMNWRLEPKEELGNERKRLWRKAGWQWEAAWPVGWPPFQLFATQTMHGHGRGMGRLALLREDPSRQGAFERALALSPLDPVDNGLK